MLAVKKMKNLIYRNEREVGLNMKRHCKLFCDKKTSEAEWGGSLYNINIEQINWQMTADFFIFIFLKKR